MGCGAYVDVQQTSTNQTKIISASPLFQSSIRKNKLKKSKHFGKKREGLEAFMANLCMAFHYICFIEFGSAFHSLHILLRISHIHCNKIQ